MKKQKPARKPLLPWGLLSVVLMLVFATTPAYGSDFATPTLHVMQQAALDGHTRSITFLASGYLSSEQDLFLKNVQTCIDALHNNSGGVVTDPWPRYAALFNMYAVFQPSSEQGAGRERLFAHNCLYMNSCGYRPSEGNNLLCAFGSPNPNIISCNLPLVLSLASFAPAEDVAVVLVNDNEASGIGTDGIAYITNYEPFMVYMLVHYLNRAIAGLQEEYSLGFSQLSDMADYGGPNCAYDPSVAESKWSIWYAFTDNADPMDGPGFGCTFSNYNSPTTNDCLMRNSSINVMCPVCREQLVRSFYDDGVPLNHLYSPTKTPINLGAGRCPPEGVTTYVTAGLTLSVGAFADQNDVTVQWTLADGTSLGTGRTLSVADTTGWTLPTTVRAVVVDSTAYVRPNWRTPLNSESIFLVASKGTATCDNPLPTCFGELTPPVTTACTACATAEDCTSKFTPQKVVLNPDDVPTAELPHDGAVGIVVATLSSTIAVAVLVIIFISHRRHIMKRPREVLDVRTFDRFIYLCLCVLSVVLLCAAVILLSYVLNSTSSRFVSGIHIILISCIFGGVTYVASIFNLVTVLKRWYVPCLVCAGIIFLDGVGFFIIGAFALWAHMNRESKQLSDALARLWHTTVSTSSGNDFICVVQKNLHCSGYHTGCFMTNSSECPTNCISNLYVNACEVPFIEVVSDLYLPVGIVCIICGFIFVLTAMLDVMYYLRYRQLSRTGKLRRSFRNDPRAPVIPITYTEASMVRISFQDVCRKPEETLEGAHAVNFLTTVFGEPLTDEYAELVAGRGPMTFDQLMCLHFPYIQAGAMDPRMLTPDEADDSSDMIELQKKQLAKLESFMVASGCLSPEQLNNIFQTYTKSRFLPDSEELLKEIRLAANDCEYEPFCKGLSPVELEGLRGAWVSLHSALSGYLSDEEIDIFYQWSHNEVVKGGTGFDKWKSSLDVSKNGGKIGWGEFCYPYAQRSLLRHARAYLAAQKKDVPPELVSRSSVEEKYTADTAEKCFMKYEQEIPIERLVAFLLRESSTKKKKAEEESNPAIQ